MSVCGMSSVICQHSTKDKILKQLLNLVLCCMILCCSASIRNWFSYTSVQFLGCCAVLVYRALRKDVEFPVALGKMRVSYEPSQGLVFTAEFRCSACLSQLLCHQHVWDPSSSWLSAGLMSLWQVLWASSVWSIFTLSPALLSLSPQWHDGEWCQLNAEALGSLCAQIDDYMLDFESPIQDHVSALMKHGTSQ